MICPWCGADVPETKFCENCGGMLRNPSASSPDGSQPTFAGIDATASEFSNYPDAQSGQTVGQRPQNTHQQASPADLSGFQQASPTDLADFQQVSPADLSGSQQASPADLSGFQPHQPESEGSQPAESTYQAPQGAPIPPAGAQTYHAYQQNSQQPPFQQGYSQTAPQADSQFQASQQPNYQQQGYAQASPQMDFQSQAIPPASEQAKKPWYAKSWVIVLFILFLWPVGLVFMWMKTCNWTKPAKIIVTVLVGLLVAFNIVSSFVTLSEVVEPVPSPVTSSAVTNSDSSDTTNTSSSNAANTSSSDTAANPDSNGTAAHPNSGGTAAGGQIGTSEPSNSSVSAENGSKEPSSATNSFVGTWTLEYLEEDGEITVGPNDIQQMEEMGIDFVVSLTLNEDGTASFILLDEVLDCTWEATSDNTATLTNEGASDTLYLVGNSLQLKSETEVISFTKA